MQAIGDLGARDRQVRSASGRYIDLAAASQMSSAAQCIADALWPQ